MRRASDSACSWDNPARKIDYGTRERPRRVKEGGTFRHINGLLDDGAWVFLGNGLNVHATVGAGNDDRTL